MFLKIPKYPKIFQKSLFFSHNYFFNETLALAWKENGKHILYASLGSAPGSAMFETYFPWNDGYIRYGKHRCTIGLQSSSHQLTKYSKQWEKIFIS